MYADDYILLTDDPENLQLGINLIKSICDNSGLKANVKKSATMVAGSENKTERDNISFTWGKGWKRDKNEKGIQIPGTGHPRQYEMERTNKINKNGS